jgi:hypothetical protein
MFVKPPYVLVILRLTLALILVSSQALAVDQELVDRLNQDLKHESDRKKAFKEFKNEKQTSEKEQNKGLALWLEEQEQWDLAREKAVFEHKKQKKYETPGEGSKEHIEDLAQKERDLRIIEDGRKQHIQTKKKVLAQYQGQGEVSEEEELAIYNSRPRYDLRKRGRNKWMKGGASMGTGSGSSGGYVPPPGGFQDNFDFPPPPPADFNNVPTDSFDDFPPPPPAPDFGNVPGTFDSGFGDAPIPPPPPPPPPEGGWDF